MTFSAKLSSVFLYFSLFFFGANLCIAQVSTIGREFYFGFMENNRIVPNRIDKASIIISASENAKGFIRFEGGNVPFEIIAGSQFVYEFKPEGFDIIHRSSGFVDNKGVYIFSDGNIAVHAFNFRERSADGTVVLPLSSIGKDYWVTAHHEEFAPGVSGGSNVNYESTLLIVGTEDDTHIEIITSAPTVNTIPAGAPINIKLNAGQSYQIKANGDLTGSRVRVISSSGDDCKNIAVFGGNKMTSVGRDCNGTTGDHLFQQMYPTATWGKEYIHIPFKGRTSGEMVKVLASENNTQIFVNGQSKGSLDAGKFLIFNFSPDEIVNISGSKPIAVTVFAKSQWCNIQNGPDASSGDPTMITLSPNLQLVKKSAFSAVKVVGIVKHYVNLIARSSAAAQTVLDGQNVGQAFKLVPGNSAYAYAQIEISEGSHTMSNPDGLIGYVYGSGFIESYGYSAGASLNNLNFTTEVKYKFDVEGDKVACLNQEGIWKIIPRDPKFQIFEWTFADGTESKTGQSVSHTFTRPGVYEIRVLAMTGDRSCDQMEESYFEVEVWESKGYIDGPEQVCPEIDLATYFFNNEQHTHSVIWEVKGGNIEETSPFSVRIQWGEFNEDASVTAIPLTKEGCMGAPIHLPIKMTPFIEPGLPKGSAEVCFSGQVTSYQVKDLIPDRQYQWTVIGGRIIKGQNAAEIEVMWDGPGIRGEIWYEEFSSSQQTCGGESKHLMVQVFPEFKATLSLSSGKTCYGLATGELKLNVSGGSGKYAFIWSHDPNLNAPVASGLSAGAYDVIVRDLSGCELVLEDLRIEEAIPLELNSILAVQDAKCYNEESGSVSFNVSGGEGELLVPGYEYRKEGEKITLLNLKQGEYFIAVQDELGCSLEVGFVIGAPEPLDAEFEVVRYACSGLANGILEVLPTGGVKPYTISWSSSPSGTALLNNIPVGTYPVQISDSHGCVLQASGVLPFGVPQLRMPTGYKPSDGLYRGVSNCEIDIFLTIYSRWGEIVYAGNDGWDGKIRGTEAPLGSYSFFVEYSYLEEGELKRLQQRGVFVLLR
jgi:hypothetical protein